MTGISPMSSGLQGIGGGGAPSKSGGNSKLEALERKLAQLKGEKEKAVRNKDGEKAKKLEEEIRKVEKQIEQLKAKEKQKKQEQDKAPENGGSGYGQMPGVGDLGNLVDVYG